MNKKKKHYKQDYYPKSWQRVDKELARDIKLALSIGWEDTKICRIYNITPAMLKECKKFKEEEDTNVSITKNRR